MSVPFCTGGHSPLRPQYVPTYASGFNESAVIHSLSDSPINAQSSQGTRSHSPEGTRTLKLCLERAVTITNLSTGPTG